VKYQKYFPWSLSLVVGLLAISIFHPEWHMEFELFRVPSKPLMYPFYVKWLFSRFGILPEPAAYGLMAVSTVAAMVVAIRIFGGKNWYVFTSIPFLWLLLFGQIDGFAAVGVVIAWIALQKKLPYWIGLGLIIASIKIQMTAGLILLIWWWSPSRWKSLAIPAAVLGLSFVQWGFWIPEWIEIIQSFRSQMTIANWNYSLWPIFGPVVWILWPIVLALPLDRMRKMIAVGAVSMMTMPYFPFYSALIYYAMPIPFFFYAVSQLWILGQVLDPMIMSWMRVLPIALFIWATAPLFRLDWAAQYRSVIGKFSKKRINPVDPKNPSEQAANE